MTAQPQGYRSPYSPEGFDKTRGDTHSDDAAFEEAERGSPTRLDVDLDPRQFPSLDAARASTPKRHLRAVPVPRHDAAGDACDTDDESSNPGSGGGGGVTHTVVSVSTTKNAGAWAKPPPLVRAPELSDRAPPPAADVTTPTRADDAVDRWPKPAVASRGSLASPGGTREKARETRRPPLTRRRTHPRRLRPTTLPRPAPSPPPRRRTSPPPRPRPSARPPPTAGARAADPGARGATSPRRFPRLPPPTPPSHHRRSHAAREKNQRRRRRQGATGPRGTAPRRLRQRRRHRPPGDPGGRPRRQGRGRDRRRQVVGAVVARQGGGRLGLDNRLRSHHRGRRRLPRGPVHHRHRRRVHDTRRERMRRRMEEELMGAEGAEGVPRSPVKPLDASFEFGDPAASPAGPSPENLSGGTVTAVAVEAAAELAAAEAKAAIVPPPRWSRTRPLGPSAARANPSRWRRRPPNTA